MKTIANIVKQLADSGADLTIRSNKEGGRIELTLRKIHGTRQFGEDIAIGFDVLYSRIGGLELEGSIGKLFSRMERNIEEYSNITTQAYQKTNYSTTMNEKKFQYLFDMIPMDGAQKVLNDWGELGWELCSVIRESKDGFTALLKKEQIIKQKK